MHLRTTQHYGHTMRTTMACTLAHNVHTALHSYGSTQMHSMVQLLPATAT